jgi:hypothetical protein
MREAAAAGRGESLERRIARDADAIGENPSGEVGEGKWGDDGMGFKAFAIY